jgi:predicted heme/steroid binding protein
MSGSASAAASAGAAHKVFTPQELSQFDGQNGNPGYIAINGIIYDVSEVQLLKDGRHHGVIPGSDVTDLFVHNKAILNRLKIVGQLG